MLLRSKSKALKQQQPTLYFSLPGDFPSRASRGLDLFLRFVMELELMHAAILGSWRSFRASCADNRGDALTLIAHRFGRTDRYATCGNRHSRREPN